MKKDLTGQRFGRLVVLEEKSRRGKSRTWLCRCDCGKETIVRQDNLKSENTKSCGCLQKDNAGEYLKKEYSNKKIGNIFIIRSIGSKNNKMIWEAKCSCGNIFYVRTSDLKRIEMCKNCRNLKVEESSRNHSKEGTYLPGISDDRKLNKNNTCGVKGVYFDKDRSMYLASITFKRKNIYLGRFTTLKDAINARKEAEEKYFKPILEKYKK